MSDKVYKTALLGEETMRIELPSGRAIKGEPEWDSIKIPNKTLVAAVSFAARCRGKIKRMLCR